MNGRTFVRSDGKSCFSDKSRVNVKPSSSVVMEIVLILQIQITLNTSHPELLIKTLPCTTELYFHILHKTNYEDSGECLSPQRTSNVSAPSGAALLLGLQKAIKGATCFSVPLPPLLDNWKPLSIGVGTRPHLQLIFHTTGP